MPQPDPLISLGLNEPRKTELPAADELQFQRAEPVSKTGEPAPAPTRRCVACKQPIAETYFHAQGQVVCPRCAALIQAGQQAPPAHSLLTAALYGIGAALAGCAIYATVAIVTGYEMALIAILVGYMVGKAVRQGSKGGGRPQQVLAVCLTYFAISTSYIPVAIYRVRSHRAVASQAASEATPDTTTKAPSRLPAPRRSMGSAVLVLLLFGLAAPFLMLRAGVGAILSLIIILIGLRQAWRLTGRADILITGPYEAASPA